MADKSYSISYKMKFATPPGGEIESPEVSFSANGAVMLDDDIPVGVLDLGPLLATLTTPKHLLIKFSDPSGFTIALDGINYSSNTYKSFLAEFGSPGLAAPIKITTTSPGKLKLLAGGDPLP